MLSARTLLAATAAAFLTASCTTTENAGKIVGSWQGAEWLVDGKPANDAGSARFEFAADGNYTYTYNGAREAGLYEINEDKLFTTPAGGQKIMVRIARLTTDSLVFDMNRGGRAETLTLVRDKK